MHLKITEFIHFFLQQLKYIYLVEMTLCPLFIRMYQLKKPKQGQSSVCISQLIT